MLGLFYDMLSTVVCITGHWQTSGRLVQEFNVFTVKHRYLLPFDILILNPTQHYYTWWLFVLFIHVSPLSIRELFIYLLSFFKVLNYITTYVCYLSSWFIKQLFRDNHPIFKSNVRCCRCERQKKKICCFWKKTSVIFSVVFRKNSGKSFFLPLTPATSYLWNWTPFCKLSNLYKTVRMYSTDI